MINFKKITLSDKKNIEACLSGNSYRACDFSFTNLYSWYARFKTVFAIERKTLFLRFEENEGDLFYMMPVGSLSVKDAMNEILKDAEERHIPFKMKGISTLMWTQISKEFPNQFTYTHDRNNDEYIYLSENLISLRGKKLQSKRNHINRFKIDNPDWEYFPLTSDAELEECRQMLLEWEADRIGDPSLKYDRIATETMLKNFDYLELKGGAIRVNGKIVAFSVGEKLTDDSFVVHVEKAVSEMQGAYTIVNQQFIENEAFQFKYINREEDMGIESLRKAKLSYQPDILLQEGIVTPIKV